MAEDLSDTPVDAIQINPLVQSTGNFGGQDTTGPNLNDPNAVGPNFNDPNAVGPNFNDPNAVGPNFNDPNAVGPNFNNPNAVGSNFNDPNAVGPNFNDPNAVGPNFNDPNAIGPNFNDPNAIGPNFNNPNAIGPNFNNPNAIGPNFNDPNAIGPNFNDPNAIGPNFNDPNAIGPNFNNPNAIGPNFNNPNAIGPNFNDPNAIGPNFNDPNAIGPNFNDPNAIGPNFNNPNAVGPNSKNTKRRNLLIALALCCCFCCCCFFVIIPLLLLLIVALLVPPNNRIPAPGSVDFGPSRFDVYCNHTYNPTTARPTRQTVENRSFVTYGFEVYPESYQYVVFELCTMDGKQIMACTGSMIDSRHILTAAHCVTSENRTNVGSLMSDFIDTKAVVEIRMGVKTARSNATADIQYMQVAGADGIYVHSNYDNISMGSADIALIRLNRSLDFNEHIKPVCLAGPKDDLPSDCVVIGFGKNEDDTNMQFRLHRAPSVAIYSSEDCSKGGMAKVSVDQMYENLKNRMPFRVVLDVIAKWMLPIYYRGKLCSLTGKDGRNICSGDSGGPLLCTPKGVASNKEYHNPSSSLFRKTDPTLKQFGITQAHVVGRSCGEEGFISMFMSVKDLRLWLEFIAWPALQEQARTKRTEKTRYDECIQHMDWKSIIEAAKLKNLEDDLRAQICRKFNNYMHCADNSPKLEHCEQLYSTILNNLSNFFTYVDLLSVFQTERCRQLAGAVDC